MIRTSMASRIARLAQLRVRSASLRLADIGPALSNKEQQEKFLQEYKIRSLLERPIYYYAEKQLPKFSFQRLYDQSQKLSSTFILQNAHETVEHLLAYNARRLKQFRNLPYLVVLNPSISESYNTYLKTMSSLITASLNPPTTLEENDKFSQEVIANFIEVHADTLPSLSKGFQEVLDLLSVDQIKDFLDEHLRERISMRLIAHQHMELTRAINGVTPFVPGGKYNGVIKLLHIPDVIKKNADEVNDIFLLKYDQSVQYNIDTNLYPINYWSRSEPELRNRSEHDALTFAYIEYHLDYILKEIFKNSFRAHIENHVEDPVQITISISETPSYLELRIRDKGKGVDPKVLRHIFDYSFTTFESNEGDAYKTLNVPPGLAGNVVAGMGYGLPLSKNYVEIFNDTIPDEDGIIPTTKGSLTIQSYFGWGTDVYIKTVGH
ncbi:two component sensor [Scheffersomyces xylosifermentans]|uniref:two component sensor n=1 Tax=Scheffersomyces xylosifermentans TaxID=1304137 RepID=UPI00315D1630